ncbi:mitochondrial import receptor subunit TOM22 homolog [Oscarella lobularis]|uniref:mitochondrial import receptor subunit TOM22 homolog n=1 Tax=Oscarella lobularis TaxID=121494 RepID=UPI00331398DE
MSVKELPDSSESYDDEPDETLGERLWGLTEMFPEKLRDGTAYVAKLTSTGLSWGYSFSRNAMWIAVSSATLLFLPIMFESERVQIQEQQQMQQRQLLLGPGAAGSTSGSSLAPPGFR